MARIGVQPRRAVAAVPRIRTAVDPVGRQVPLVLRPCMAPHSRAALERDPRRRGRQAGGPHEGLDAVVADGQVRRDDGVGHLDRAKIRRRDVEERRLVLPDDAVHLRRRSVVGEVVPDHVARAQRILDRLRPARRRIEIVVEPRPAIPRHRVRPPRRVAHLAPDEMHDLDRKVVDHLRLDAPRRARRLRRDERDEVRDHRRRRERCGVERVGVVEHLPEVRPQVPIEIVRRDKVALQPAPVALLEPVGQDVGVGVLPEFHIERQGRTRTVHHDVRRRVRRVRRRIGPARAVHAPLRERVGIRARPRERPGRLGGHGGPARVPGRDVDRTRRIGRLHQADLLAPDPRQCAVGLPRELDLVGRAGGGHTARAGPAEAHHAHTVGNRVDRRRGRAHHGAGRAGVHAIDR